MEEQKSTNQQPSQPNSEYAWLESMPEAVRDWLISSELTYLIINLNRRLGFEGVKTSVMPELILKIVLKEITPEKLADSLARELNLDPMRAVAVAQEIEEKMLRPIENPLRKEMGVDIKRIYISGALAMPRPSSPTPPPPLVYRPTNPTTFSPPVYRPATTTPAQTPQIPSAPKEMPVKINVQKPAGDPPRLGDAGQPFGPDSWVNKVK